MAVSAVLAATSARPPPRRLNIAWLCKRRYMHHDVIDDRYARLYELPAELARRGHHVLALCLDYHGHHDTPESAHEAAPGTLTWQAWSLGRSVLPGLARYLRGADAALAAFAPDIVLGSSDCPHAVLARRAAARRGCLYGIDLYDNYASFGLARLPGLARAYHRALHSAALVTCVSTTLAAHIAARHAPRGQVLVLESTIGADLFKVRDRAACRAALGLPTALRLVGTAGALDRDRDVGTLFEAYARLRRDRDDVALVLAGHGDLAPPDLPGVIHLGQLPHARVAELFAALDVAVICLADSDFGRYAFPQKAYEIIACRTPVIGARVGALAVLLEPWPLSLYRPGDGPGLAAQIAAQLEAPVPVPLAPPTWREQAARLEQALFEALATTPPPNSHA